MAKATTETRTFVTLELTSDEAQTLTNIMAVVGGNPNDTQRGNTDAVLAALREAGFNYGRRQDHFEEGADSLIFHS